MCVLDGYWGNVNQPSFSEYQWFSCILYSGDLKMKINSILCDHFFCWIDFISNCKSEFSIIPKICYWPNFFKLSLLQQCMGREKC